MASQGRRRISWLAVLALIFIWSVFVVFMIASGDFNKPVSALSTTYWVLLISVLLVSSLLQIGVELGLIPRWQDNPGWRFRPAVVAMFTGAILLLSAIGHGRSVWYGSDITSLINGGYILLVSILVFIRRLSERSK
jgi:hypothetical protein